MVRGDAVTMAVTPRGALEAQLTRTGTLLGTPAYMAPEQLRGESATARADQFAFAVTAWEALTGARPYAGATIGDIARAMDRGEPAEAASVPRTVRPALERALAVDPANRWPSMTALLAALEPSPATRRSRRLPLIGAGVAFVLLGGGVALWKSRGASTDSISRACGGHMYRVSSGQHGSCRETVVSPTIFEMQCTDKAGNRGALECGAGISNCETAGTGTCGIAD